MWLARRALVRTGAASRDVGGAPTGEPPPLPHSIQPTAVWWTAGAAVLVAVARVAFGPARGSLGVAVTAWDDAVVR